MSNLDLYNDYNGPSIAIKGSEDDNDADDGMHDYDEDNNPLRCGLWMEGDSLAPPCGSSIPFIHSMLSVAKVSSGDALYDLGCGDGRICFEALVKYHSRQVVGIEIEKDLVDKANLIKSRLPKQYQVKAADHDKSDETITGIPRIQIIEADLRDCLGALVGNHQDSKRTSQNQQDGGGVFPKLPTPTIIILYLLPESIRMIEHQLITLMEDGVRICCISWGLSRVRESKSVNIEEGASSTTIFLYDKT